MTSTPPQPTQPPPAGWYADPNNAGSSRWWDGAAWTEHAEQSSASPVQRVVVVRNPFATWGAVVGAAAVVVPFFVRTMDGNAINVALVSVLLAGLGLTLGIVGRRVAKVTRVGMVAQTLALSLSAGALLLLVVYLFGNFGMSLLFG